MLGTGKNGVMQRQPKRVTGVASAVCLRSVVGGIRPPSWRLNVDAVAREKAQLVGIVVGETRRRERA